MLNIHTANRGFYNGFNPAVALSSKLVIACLVIWCVIAPEQAGKVLGDLKNASFTHLTTYYNWLVGLFVMVCLGLALVPKWGRLKLGQGDDLPEFSRFSWFSMMFGAGIGIGMLGFATGEPIWYFADNPEIRLSLERIAAALEQQGVNVAGLDSSTLWIKYHEAVANSVMPMLDNLVEPKTRSAIIPVFRYEFLHWGISAWACYAIVGLALSYFSYRQNLPLTIRSTLFPVFGKAMAGWRGTTVDAIAVIATLVGIGQTIGLGLSTFASGLYNISEWAWLITDERTRTPTNAALFLALFVVMLCSTLSAWSGVGRGVKWLSNLNMVLSVALLSFFLVFGATWAFFEILGVGLVDYLLALPSLTFYIYPTQSPGSPGEWQAQWSVFYWAWWIAFAPFVGLFLARISKNRTVREFILGALLAPALMCCVWFALLGGTALELILEGTAGAGIFEKTLTGQLFEIINIILSPAMAKLMSIVIVVLLLTFLVTSADSATLVARLVSAGGNTANHSGLHIVVWSGLLAAMIAALLIAGGLDAIQSAMIVGAAPFSVLMVFMVISLVKEICFKPG